MSAQSNRIRYLTMTALFGGAIALACSSKGSGNGYTSTGPGGGGGDTTPTVTGGHATTITATGSAQGATHYFTPTPDTIAAGTALTWSFSDVTHTVDFGGVSGAPDSIGSSTNTTVARTFSTAGSYAYHCDIHTYMHGTVVVTAATAYAAPGRKPRIVQLAMR